MSFRAWKPYVPVAKRREQAARKLTKLQKKGEKISPVVARRTIASSFWGKSWCDNLERYSDYANRLPRGRTYVRNGSVVDLQISKGEVTAKVAGSELYSISITIAPVAQPIWKALAKDCAGNIDSVVELLQGKLAKGVMDRVCRQGDGLFPAPKEIKLSCSCPDWAGMCKHVAAALYGVGARLDEQPELLFLLRGVDQQELIARAGRAPAMAALRKPAKSAKVLGETDLASVFGLDMAAETDVQAKVGVDAGRATAPRAVGKAQREPVASNRVPTSKARARPVAQKVATKPPAKSRAASKVAAPPAKISPAPRRRAAIKG